MVWGMGQESFCWLGQESLKRNCIFVPTPSLSYQLRIECMLSYEETAVMLDMLQPKAEAIRKACEGKWDGVTPQRIVFRAV